MEKIRIMMFTLTNLIICNIYSQDSVIQEGLLTTQMTLSPSAMIKQKESNFYIHGSIAYYISPQVSLDGDGYYQLGAISSEIKTFQYNHNLFFGASKHFCKNENDFFVSIQPGVSISKVTKEISNLDSTQTGINPVFSVSGGYKFFINNYFHFFFQTRYIAGKHIYDSAQSLSEIRFSAGLGFNLNTKRKKSS